MGKPKPPFSHRDFEALALFAKHLNMRLERLENGLPPLPPDERIRPAPPGDHALTLDHSNAQRLDEVEARVEDICQLLEREARRG
jgi:hypothetical protein